MRLPTRGGATGPAAVNRYLLPNEQQVITVRRHPAILIGPSALTLAGLLAAGVLSATVLRSDGTLVTVVWLAWLVLFVRMIWKTINWAVDFFVVTSHRILLTSGVLTRKVAMMPARKPISSVGPVPTSSWDRTSWPNCVVPSQCAAFGPAAAAAVGFMAAGA